MISALQKSIAFLQKWILPPINVLIFFSSMYSALYKILNWDLLVAWSNANIHRLLSFLGQSSATTGIDFGGLDILLARVFLITCLLILIIKNKTIRTLRFWLNALPLLGILLVDYLSRFWSIKSTFSISRYLYFSFAVISGLYLGLEWKKGTLRVLFEIFSALIVISVYASVFRVPSLATMGKPGFEGNWIGPFWYNSYSGELLGFATIMFLLRWLDFKKNRWFVTAFAGLFYLLALFATYKTGSATGQLALIAAHLMIGLGLLYIKWGQKMKTRHLVIVGLVCLLGVAIAWFSRVFWLVIFQRNATLTGRIPMWEALVPYIRERIWLGYGFGEAFWKTSLEAAVSQAAGWGVPFAHNGYIEVLLSTGIIGSLLWIAFLVQVSALSWKHFRQAKNIDSMIFLAWLAFIFISNIAQSMLGSYEYFTIVLLTLAFAWLTREGIQIPRNKPSPPVDSQEPALAEKSA